MQKYFINENIELNKSFKIESSDQYHIEKVMRNKNGDQIICVDLKHIQYLCSIENVQKGTILPIEKLDINNELDVEVTLVYALPKGDKFELRLQDNIIAQDLGKIALGCGLGLKNPRAFGFTTNYNKVNNYGKKINKCF